MEEDLLLRGGFDFARRHGLRAGQLVELLGERGTAGAGRLAQVQHFAPEVGDVAVQLLDSGQWVSASLAEVRSPSPWELRADFSAASAAFAPDPEEAASGARVGAAAAEACDIVLGQQTQPAAFGAEVAACLLDKGFCVVRCLDGGDLLPVVVDALRCAEMDGWFGRLQPEVEEGHLGRNGRARTMWVDPDDWPEVGEEAWGFVAAIDAGMTSVAQALQAHCADVLGCELSDRTPALACMPLSYAAEAEGEAPARATDEELSDFYATWRRSCLRLVHFLGPSTRARCFLRPRGDDLAEEDGDEEFAVPARPNTLVIARLDTLEYELEEVEGEETCWMQCFLMSPAQVFVIDGQMPDLGVLLPETQGPPPPTEETVSVVSMALQTAAGMMDHCKEWAAYMAGADGQLEIPVARFDYRPYYDEEVDNPKFTTYVKHNGMQDGVELFDNKIFEIAFFDASAMDPQCRQVLEVGCSLLFQRGITKRWCNTNAIHASVSVGCDKEEWLNMPEAPMSVATNNQLAITANRFNYVFNLKGGSFVADTACSSSLVAMHLGKLALKEQRWDALEFHLAMGTNITLTHRLLIGSSMNHMLSPGGRCFTFNTTANGYNRGDGTAGLMLKLGERPEERWAFVRGTQIGQDGRSASLSAPNGPAQEKCIWGAIREARMRPPESTVWECHGTGTALGDPIEVGAVRRVQIREKRQEPLMISTSKSNIGHLEGSAAMVAMCKCVVTVLKTTCAPTQHLEVLNAHLNHSKFDAIFCTEANPWRYRQGHCQVSSFGVGGTNGHAVFWGASPKKINQLQAFLKLVRQNPPTVIVRGTDPANWEFDRLKYSDKKGEHCVVSLAKDPITSEVSVRYDVVERERPPSFYCIVGSHNGWTDDRMVEGDVKGLWYAVVDVPDSGTLDFRLCADGRVVSALGPPQVACRTQAAPVIGPEEGLATFWRAEAAPGDALRIEFLTLGPEARSVTWLLEDNG